MGGGGAHYNTKPAPANATTGALNYSLGVWSALAFWQLVERCRVASAR